MADDYASAIRGGTMAAGRLHRQLALRERIEGQGGGNIDVFASMVALELPLLLRPLRNLLGAYLREPRLARYQASRAMPCESSTPRLGRSM